MEKFNSYDVVINGVIKEIEIFQTINSEIFKLLTDYQ